MGTSLREWMLIEADLITRLKRRTHQLTELVCVGTLEQTRRELAELVAAGAVEHDAKRDRYRYVGLDRRLGSSARQLGPLLNHHRRRRGT